jgi:hypothetical protein
MARGSHAAPDGPSRALRRTNTRKHRPARMREFLIFQALAEPPSRPGLAGWNGPDGRNGEPSHSMRALNRSRPGLVLLDVAGFHVCNPAWRTCAPSQPVRAGHIQRFALTGEPGGHSIGVAETLLDGSHRVSYDNGDWIALNPDAIREGRRSQPARIGAAPWRSRGESPAYDSRRHPVPRSRADRRGHRNPQNCPESWAAPCSPENLGRTRGTN